MEGWWEDLLKSYAMLSLYIYISGVDELGLSNRELCFEALWCFRFWAVMNHGEHTNRGLRASGLNAKKVPPEYPEPAEPHVAPTGVYSLIGRYSMRLQRGLEGVCFGVLRAS